MLLVGAFYGRAGGLILLGLLATVGLAGATAADNWDGTDRLETPGHGVRGPGATTTSARAS